MPQANQYRDAEGNEKPDAPEGTNHFKNGTRNRMDPKQRDAIRAEFAAKQLEAHMKGEVTLSDSQVTAAKALMPYGKATLQSIQQTIEEKPVDEQEIAGALAHIISANPGILAPLVQADPGVRAALQAILSGQPTVVQSSNGPDAQEIGGKSRLSA